MYEYRRGAARAPEFVSGSWLNTAQPVTLAQLWGQVTLVDIWDYSCGECLRTLPYVRQWERRYQARGLQVISVHTPRFAFGREQTQVELAAAELDLTYPVLLDNDFQMWMAYKNRMWPTKYLIDRHGYLRYRYEGYGDYAALEAALQGLLREADPDVELPPVIEPAEAADRPGRSTPRPTPPLYAGLQGRALGNPEGYAGVAPIVYSLPTRRVDGAFYLAGAWQSSEQYLAYQGQTEGTVQIPYEGEAVYAVLTPHVDVVERMLHPRLVQVEVWQDEQPLGTQRQGTDLTADGRLLVDRPRLYHLIRNPGFERHEVTLRIKTRGFGFYTFSFSSGG